MLVDDSSADGTGAVVAQRWPRVGVVRPGGPEPGWAGKLWALRAGVAEAGAVDLLLFTDADITHPPRSLTALVCAAPERGLDLGSLMARLRLATGLEPLVVPGLRHVFPV